MKNDKWPRRSLMSGLGASVAAFVFGSKAAAAQTPPAAFQPARHAQDEWFDKLPGKHRVFIDVVSAAGAGEAVAFANNLYTANKNAYGIEEGDLAMVMCLRHSATVFAFTDAIWSKHGKALADAVEVHQPARRPGRRRPTRTPSPRATRSDRWPSAGMQFAVCDTASHRFARMLAGHRRRCRGHVQNDDRERHSQQPLRPRRRRGADTLAGIRLQPAVRRTGKRESAASCQVS